MFIKKNQIIVFVLALLLITAGYLGVGQQSAEVLQIAATSNEIGAKDENENLGDATFVNGTVAPTNTVTNENISAISTETSTTTNTTTNDDYFATSKLERENMYSQTLASYQKIIDSTVMNSCATYPLLRYHQYD